jgi:hypothetical protein
MKREDSKLNRAIYAVSAMLGGTRIGAAWDVAFNCYEAARFSIERSFLRATLQEARLDITKHTREELQRKSRYFEKNSSLYNKIADLWEQYVTGTGLQFYATTATPAWNALADRAWEQWKPFADISSRFGFDNLQGIAVRSLFVDGEVFILLTRDPANNRPRIQLIEAHRCKTPEAMLKQEGVSIVDGVEVDQSGRPVAYWFSFGETEMRRFDAFSIVHIFEPARPGQMRGIPYISSALNILHDLDDLQILEMRHKKVVSENSLNVFTATGDLPPGMNAATGRFRDVAGVTASGATTTEKRLEYYKSAYGGRVNVAMHGDKIEEQTSDRPNVATRDYWRMLEEKVCCAAGVPLVIALPDSMQGTVYRGSLDAANAFFRCKTSVLATYFKRIREYVLNMEGSFFPPLGNRPFDWQSCDYLPPAAVNTDIGYNSAANINELTAGLKSWDDILLPQGRKAEPVLRRKAELQLYIKRLAASLSSNAEGIEISPEEIASLDIIHPPEVMPEPVNVPDLVTNAAKEFWTEGNIRTVTEADKLRVIEADKIKDSLEKLKTDLKTELSVQNTGTSEITTITRVKPPVKPRAVKFNRDDSGRICGATLEEVEA